jgi:TRAP-type uncharacterized transport system substrate-binding protein
MKPPLIGFSVLCMVLGLAQLTVAERAGAQEAQVRSESTPQASGQQPESRTNRAGQTRRGAQQRGPLPDVPQTGAIPAREPRPEETTAAQARTEDDLADRLNAHTVSVISGTPGGTYFRMASDMAFVLDAEDLRVLPMLGKGAGQNAYDIRFLKGVDLGFVRTDTLNQLRDDKRLKNIERHINYVAKLFNDELHVIANRDVKDIRELEGRRVSFDVKGSGTDYTGRSMFRLLGVNVDAVNVDQPTALELLKKGELTAVVSVAAKPVAVIANFDPGDQFHFVPVPYTEAIADKYVPAFLTRAAYPRFVQSDENVKTLAVGTVLGVYNWPPGSEKHKRIARFVNAFFSKIDQFQAPQRHPKWREVNIAAEVPGWTRFRPAQEWLKTHRPGVMASNIEFERFLSETSPSPEMDKERLYDSFLMWRKERGF